MAGRKPKPTALKLITGNPGNRPLNKKEPKPKQAVRVPSPPTELGKKAKAEWRRIAKELHTTGILTLIDIKALANYCQAYDDMLTARGLLNAWNIHNPDQINVLKTMQGMIRTHPYLQQMQEARRDMMKFAVEFGMTPSSRSRVDAVDVGKKGSAWDDF